MSRASLVALTLLALLAFAGNSLLCRLALSRTAIDPASFTALRLVAGAVVLQLVLMARRGGAGHAGNWRSALALFAYAAAFSYAYQYLGAATGALLLFAAVQATMTGYGLYRGEKLGRAQWAGLALALGGLVALLLPGLSAPPPGGAVLMLGAGIAWGVYSLRGRGADDPVAVTAGNFARAALPALLLTGGLLATGLAPRQWPPADGLAWALASGGLTSGLGYVIWYAALPGLRATSAATVQLIVPALAAAGGVVLLGEAMSPRLALTALAILGGIALVTLRRAPV